MGFFSFLSGKSKQDEAGIEPLFVDFHSHLLPGIDDGCQTMEETLDNIEELKKQGITRIITTPHIFNELYPNTPEIIRGKLNEVRKALRENKIDVEIEATAEYYLDEWFIKNYKTMELLTIKGKYLLVETNYIDRPYFLEQILFDLQTSGYRVIFAHPERYNYLIQDFRQFHELFDTGILFQCNLLSFTGYYSPRVQKAAEYLLKHKMIHMVGSDTHKMRHTATITKFKQSKEYRNLLRLNLLNNSL